jgi:uncharacterized protein (DUF2141 family)
MLKLILLSKISIACFSKSNKIGNIKFVVQGINLNKGQIVITLYNKEKGFSTKSQLASKQYTTSI